MAEEEERVIDLNSQPLSSAETTSPMATIGCVDFRSENLHLEMVDLVEAPRLRRETAKPVDSAFSAPEEVTEMDVKRSFPEASVIRGF